MRAFVLALIVAAIGCSDDAPRAEDPEIPAPIVCAEHAVPVASTCIDIGVPRDGCAPGFTHNGAGACAPTLPIDVCPIGKYAVPGDTECHDVGACEEPPADDAPSFVRAGATGGDGSRDRPFGTIQAAVDAAASGGRVFIDEGRYDETITIDKPLTLQGRCAARVEIVSRDYGAINVNAAATIRGLSITKGIQGIRVRANGVAIDDVWIHYTGGTGVVVIGGSAVLRRSLIEQTRNSGVYAEGGSLRVEASALRELEMLEGAAGFGAMSQIGRDGTPANITLSGSLVERAHATAVASLGSEVVVEGSVLRDSLGRKEDAAVACVVARNSGGRDPLITVRSSVLDRCAGSGIAVERGKIVVERSVVTNSLPHPATSRFGYGLIAYTNVDVRVSDSLFAHNHYYGLLVLSGALTVERTIVRDMQPQASNNAGGIAIAAMRENPVHTSLRVDQSAIVRARTVGLAANGADAIFTGTIVRDTDVQVSDGLYGDGMQITASFTEDGVALPIDARVEDCFVQNSKRAALAVLAADIHLARTKLACARIPLALIGAYTFEGRAYSGPATLNNGGGNDCGCDAPAGCHAVTEGVEPVGFSGAR